MLGYWEDQNLTKETIGEDGWLHSGDTGKISASGSLKIDGRIKDIFKTSKGKYVAPLKIESLFSKYLIIDQVCVMGADHAQPVAVVSLAGTNTAPKQDKLNELLVDAYDEINGQLQPHERLSHIIVDSISWTPNNGLLTTTQKLKRNKVEEHYIKVLGTIIKESKHENIIVWLWQSIPGLIIRDMKKPAKLPIQSGPGQTGSDKLNSER